MRIAYELIKDGETKDVYDWARELGVDTKTVGRRLARGWPVKCSLFVPPLVKWSRRKAGVLK